MDKNTLGFADMTMERGEQNMNRRKLNSVPASPKTMTMASQVPRTPLMDVKNQFRSKARERMSTGSMKNTNLSFKHRLSLNNQDDVESTQRKVKIFKPPHDKGEGQVALTIPTVPEHGQDDMLTSVTSSSVEEIDLHGILIESVIDRYNETPVEKESLKDMFSVLDHDNQTSVDFTEVEIEHLEQNENESLSEVATPLHKESESFESINNLSTISSGLDGLLDIHDRLVRDKNEEVCAGLAVVGENIDITEDLTLGELSINDQLLQEVSGIDEDPKQQFSGIADGESLSSSFGDSLNETELLLRASDDFEITGSGLDKLSSMRFVEENEELSLSTLLEKTLTDEIEHDLEHHASVAEVEEITSTLDRLTRDNSGYASLFYEMRIAEDSVVDSEPVDVCELNAKANVEPTDEMLEASESLLADLSLSEVEVLNGFDCTVNMSKFIDEFLKETPLGEGIQATPLLLNKQTTIGKRDVDIMFSDGNVDNSESSFVQQMIETEKNQIEEVSEKDSVLDETDQTMSAPGMEKPLVEVSEDQRTKDDESEKVGAEELTKDDESSDKIKVVDNMSLSSNENESLMMQVQEDQMTKDGSELEKVVSEKLPKGESSDVENDVVTTTEIAQELTKGQSSDLVNDGGVTVTEIEPRSVPDGEVSLSPGGNNGSLNLTTVGPTRREIVDGGVPDLYSDRVSKVMDALRDAYVSVSNVVGSSNNTVPPSIEKVVGSSSDEVPKLTTAVVETVHRMSEEETLSLNPGVSESPNPLDETKKSVDDLEALLVEEMLKTRELEGHVKDVEKKCSHLEKDRLNSELKFAKELQRLKSDYTQNICHRQTEEDQNAGVMNQEFDDVMSEVERLTSLQRKLKDMLNRVMRTTNESLAGYARLLKDYSTLKQNHQNLETKFSAATMNNKKLVDDVEVLENFLQRSNDNLSDLHQLYQEEIGGLKTQVSSLTDALSAASKEKEDLNKNLEDHVSKLQQSLDRLETERHASLEELEDCRFLLEHQKERNLVLSEEVNELRKVKVDWVAGQDLIKELEETVAFLNEERDLTAADYGNKLETAIKQRDSLEEQSTSLMRANEEYQKSQDLLQTEVSGLRETLFVTSEDANMLFLSLEDIEAKAEMLLDTLQKKFGHEMSMSCDSSKKILASTTATNSSFVAQVLGKAGGGEGQNQTTCSSKSCSKPKFWRQSNVEYRSLRKIHNSNTSSKTTQDNSQSLSFSTSKLHSTTKVPSSRKALNFSSPLPVASTDEPSHATITTTTTSSCQAHGTMAATCQTNVVDGLNASSVSGFAHIRSIPVASEKKNNDNEGGSLSTEEDDDESNVMAICENVLESIEQKFSLILKIAQTVDRASRFQIRDLKGEVEILGEKLNSKRKQFEKADSELGAKKHQLLESSDEVAMLNERVNRMTQAILQHEDMVYEVKRLEEDNCDLRQEVTSLQGEREMLAGQVQDLIVKAGGGDDFKAALTRVAALEKKNYQQHFFMLQEQEKHRDKGDKAMRRIRVLETNLKRAEEEVYKFDELVEAIRNTCIENRSMRPHPVLLHVVRLIDGLVEVKVKATPAGQGKQPNKVSAANVSASSSSNSNKPSVVSSASASSSTRGKEIEYPV